MANLESEKELKAKEPKDPQAKGPEAQKPQEPVGVELKEVAKQAGMEPREVRAILRKLGARGEDRKRARWTFQPSEVAAVVAKLKGTKAQAAIAKDQKVKAQAG